MPRLAEDFARGFARGWREAHVPDLLKATAFIAGAFAALAALTP